MEKDSQTIAHIYNQHGEAYHASRAGVSGRVFNECIDIPAVLSLLSEDLSDLCILDAGCGSGLYAGLLARRGARVTGIDVSATMIEIARRETPVELHVEYVVGELGQLPFQNEAFDMVICAYVLENIPDLAAVFAEFSRVLTGQGSCIFSISHPLRAYAKKAEVDGKAAWILDEYFERSMRQSDFGGGMLVPKYKRPLADYIAALAEAGFVVTRLLEPRPTPEGEEIDPETFEMAQRLPQVLTMRLQKNALLQ